MRAPVPRPSEEFPIDAAGEREALPFDPPVEDEVREHDPQAQRGEGERRDRRQRQALGPAQTALWGMVNGLVPWGEDHHREFAQVYDHTATLVAITEDLAEETNTVTLDPELTDAHGIPAPRVTYQLSENSRKMLAHAVERATEALTAAGAVKVIAMPLLRDAGWHLLGTARMGRNPRSSVVNERGQAHDVKNLFIVDGSIFVSAGGVNPTSTIQALALYVADGIKKNLATLFDHA